jgi:cytoskeletal protein RodZ
VTSKEPTKLGEVLRTAREARFIDLARVERDTKIRTQYLSALERGDYRDLPGAVYAKGFLRNYGLYLGLDPEYLIDLYRLEQGSGGGERPQAPVPPRPIAGRSRALVITPGRLAAVTLVALVAAFAVYLVTEFVTFARTPDLRITDPAGDLAAWSSLAYLVRGSTEPNSTITIDGLRENPTVTADARGDFHVRVTLVPGANVMTLVASDPRTGRDSAPVTRTIMVANAKASSPPGGMALDKPAPGATLTGGVALSGTAPAGARLTVTAALVVGPTPSFTVVSLGGGSVTVPLLRPTAPKPLAIASDAAGSFSGQLALPLGTWDLTLRTAGAAALSVTRRVVVAPAAGLHGRLTVVGAASYLEIDQDGRPMAGVSGLNAAPGAVIDLSATGRLRIRVGNAVAVRLTINGLPLGSMGGSGAVVEWEITRP